MLLVKLEDQPILLKEVTDSLNKQDNRDEINSLWETRK